MRVLAATRDHGRGIDRFRPQPGTGRHQPRQVCEQGARPCTRVATKSARKNAVAMIPTGSAILIGPLDAVTDAMFLPSDTTLTT
jgi:hypothetical protein